MRSSASVRDSGKATTLKRVQCDYYDAGVCRSCTLMGTAYSQQLATKDARCWEYAVPMSVYERHTPAS